MKLYQIILLLEGPREEYVIDKMGQKLLSANRRDGRSVNDVIILVSQLSDMDPTNNKQYLQWIAKQYSNGKFRLEDGLRIREVLHNFNQLKSRLIKRDINQYDLHELEREMDTVIGGGDTDNKVQTHKKLPDVIYLYDGPLGILAIPKTSEASDQLGRGTKWCTSARQSNMFDQYNDKGSLYIWIDRSGEKYQFWVEGHHYGTVSNGNDTNQPLNNESIIRTVLTKEVYAESQINDAFSTDIQIMDSHDVPVSEQKLKLLLSIPPLTKFIAPIIKVNTIDDKTYDVIYTAVDNHSILDNVVNHFHDYNSIRSNNEVSTNDTLKSLVGSAFSLYYNSLRQDILHAAPNSYQLQVAMLKLAKLTTSDEGFESIDISKDQMADLCIDIFDLLEVRWNAMLDQGGDEKVDVVQNEQRRLFKITNDPAWVIDVISSTPSLGDKWRARDRRMSSIREQ